MTEPLRKPLSPETPPALLRLRAALPQPLRSALRSGAELVRARREAGEDAPLPTAVPALDRLLGGGLPRGRLVEMLGGKSGGRLALVLAALAAATATGEAAALVDLGDQLDPQGAVAAGVDLTRLLWLRPERTADALAAAEMAVTGGFPLVVLDLGVPPLAGGRGAEPFWVRLGRAAQTHGAALLVSTPYRVSGTAAGAVVRLGRGRGVWAGTGRAPALFGGLAGEIALEKLRGTTPDGRSAPLVLRAAHDPLAALPAADPKTASTMAGPPAVGPERRRAAPASPAAVFERRPAVAWEQRRAAAGGR